MKKIFFVIFSAAEASRCAGELGKCWEMHDHLFANSNALEKPDLVRHTTVLNLDVMKFQEYLDSGKYIQEIRKDLAEGQRAGVKGTPTFLIGIPEQGSTRMKALKRIRGAQPYPVFKDALDSLINSPK